MHSLITGTHGARPRNGRLERNGLAIAAATALLLFAALPAKAGIVGMTIDPTQSFVTVSEIIDLTELGGGVHVTTPQFPDPDGAGPLTGSNKTSLSGNVVVSFGGGFSTISFPGGSQVNYDANNTPGVGGVPGSYAPFDPVVSDPPFPAVGATPNSSYGLEVGSPLFWSEARHGLIADLVGPVRPIAGVSFALVPGSDLLLGTAGRIAMTSALFSDTKSVVGEVIAALGTGGATAGTWDGITLTVPIESSFTVQVDTGFIVPGTSAYITYVSNSSIVATPIVPEPASVVLAGLGLVGLSGFAWRFRSRRDPTTRG